MVSDLIYENIQNNLVSPFISLVVVKSFLKSITSQCVVRHPSSSPTSPSKDMAHQLTPNAVARLMSGSNLDDFHPLVQINAVKSCAGAGLLLLVFIALKFLNLALISFILHDLFKLNLRRWPKADNKQNL